MSERSELWKILDAIQMDARALSAKIVELRAKVAALEIPNTGKTVCPRCGVPCKGPRTLADHLHVSHDGPVPDYEVALEARILVAEDAA